MFKFLDNLFKFKAEVGKVSKNLIIESYNTNWTAAVFGNRNESFNAQIDPTIYSSTGSVLDTQSKTLNKCDQDAFIVGAGLSQEKWLPGLAFTGGNANPGHIFDKTLIPKTSTTLIVADVVQNNIRDSTIFTCNPSPFKAALKCCLKNESYSSHNAAFLSHRRIR